MVAELDFKNLIEPSWIQTYEKYVEAIWWQLVHLNTYLLLIERIETFRFDIFQITPFWVMVKKAMLEASLMSIWRVAVDDAPTVLTLGKLKKEIEKHLRADAEVRERMRDVSNAFKIADGTIRTLKESVEKIRHNYLAHFDQEMNTNPTTQQLAETSLSLAELTRLRDKVKELFDLLCFGYDRIISLLQYHPNMMPFDIDDLLDTVARNSVVLNLPESNSVHWQLIRDKHYSKATLAVINEYRRKFGLPEA